MKKVNIASSNVIEQIVNAANLNISAINVSANYPLNCIGGRKYSVYNILGRTIDNTDCVLLIAKVSASADENASVFIGDVYELRGGGGMLPVASKYKVRLIKSRANDVVAESENGTKAGICAYDGESYLALRLPRGMSREISFTGYYSGNCVFLIVEEAKVAWSE